MALVLLASASYAAYVTKQKADLAKIDESIQLEGKTKLTLLPSEQKAVVEIPITTLSWFDGDYQTVRDALQHRIDLIVVCNPYLAGWLIMDAGDSYNLKLLYDEKGEDGQQGLFRVYDDIFEDKKPTISIHTPYAKCTEQLIACGAMLPNQHELVGKDKAPLFRLSVIPDAEDPTGRFALVLSMTRALGDAHTYYKFLNMLNLEETAPQVLVAKRESEFVVHVKAAMGNEAVDYLTTGLKQPPVDLTETRNEPTVIKAFHVKEDWFPRKDKRARRASMFDPTGKDFHAHASALAVAAASAVDEACTEDVSVSENSILASWFFQLNQADVAFMVMSLRGRIAKELVSDVHAGSYTWGIPYTPIDYASPDLIEKSVSKLQRCGDDGVNEVPPLPAFRWNNSASISSNWASLFPDKLQLSSTCTQRSHIALYDAEMFKSMPGRSSFCFMFTSQPSDKSSGGNTKKRAGVLIACRQSVWEKIQESGIVDEILMDS